MLYRWRFFRFSNNEFLNYIKTKISNKISLIYSKNNNNLNNNYLKPNNNNILKQNNINYLNQNNKNKNQIIKKQNNKNNYIIIEIEIKGKDINEDIRIINSYEQHNRDHKWL